MELIGKVETSVSMIRSGKEQDVIDELLEMVARDELNFSEVENELENNISQLKQLLDECRCERDLISCKLAEHLLDKAKIKKLLGKRVGIIGGHSSEIKKIETMLNQDLGIKIRSTPGEVSPPPYSKLKDKYRNADLLIILNGYAGHALTDNAERLSDEFGISKIYDSAGLLNSIKLKVIEALA